MSERIEGWLQGWGGWLDGLLATGLGSPSEQTRGQIRHWCVDAELLGFAEQVQQAQTLLSDHPTMAERQQAFLDLLLEHDMLVRLHQAQALLDRAAVDEVE